MIDIEPIDQLLCDKELALSVFKEIPLMANRMRMNQGHAMFYRVLLIDYRVKQWKYLRYSNRYTLMNLDAEGIANFEEMNNVFIVNDFRLAVYQLYTSDAYSVDEAKQILKDKPISAISYNPITKSYWRVGNDGYLEEFSKQGDNSYKWQKTQKKEIELNLFTISLKALKFVS